MDSPTSIESVDKPLSSLSSTATMSSGLYRSPRKQVKPSNRSETLPSITEYPKKGPNREEIARFYYAEHRKKI